MVDGSGATVGREDVAAAVDAKEDGVGPLRTPGGYDGVGKGVVAAAAARITPTVIGPLVGKGNGNGNGEGEGDRIPLALIVVVLVRIGGDVGVSPNKLSVSRLIKDGRGGRPVYPDNDDEFGDE
jgi:hypothetical protein